MREVEIAPREPGRLGMTHSFASEESNEHPSGKGHGLARNEVVNLFGARHRLLLLNANTWKPASG